MIFDFQVCQKELYSKAYTGVAYRPGPIVAYTIGPEPTSSWSAFVQCCGAGPKP